MKNIALIYIPKKSQQKINYDISLLTSFLAKDRLVPQSNSTYIGMKNTIQLMIFTLNASKSSVSFETSHFGESTLFGNLIFHLFLNLMLKIDYADHKVFKISKIRKMMEAIHNRSSVGDVCSSGLLPYVLHRFELFLDCFAVPIQN